MLTWDTMEWASKGGYVSVHRGVNAQKMQKVRKCYQKNSVDQTRLHTLLTAPQYSDLMYMKYLIAVMQYL